MGVSRLMAAIYDRFMAETEAACLAGWRHELLQHVGGSVLDLGAGTGANVAQMPAHVKRLVLCEPDPHMTKKLHQKVPRAEIVSATAEALPFEDGSFDAVACMLVLCTVVDPARALAEIRRVLKPGGKLVFIEHVAAPEKRGRFFAQRCCEPLWKHLAGNCHLTRNTEAAIAAAGFEFKLLQRQSMRKALPILRTTIRGVAQRRPAG
jgi:ubiquinone/menaquinone biosynthesis C-methylase UbiE